MSTTNSPSSLDKLGKLAALIEDVYTSSGETDSLDKRVSTLLSLPSVSSLQDRIRRYLVEQSDLTSAVKTLLYHPQMWGELLQLLTENTSFDIAHPHLKQEETISHILILTGLKQIAWSPSHRGVNDIIDILDQKWKDIRYINERVRVAPRTIMEIGGIGWGYLGTLLEISIRYYTKVFGSDDTCGKVGTAFKHAITCNTLVPLLQSIHSIENSFAQDGEARQLSQWLFQRASPFEGFFKGKEDLERAKLSDEDVKSLRKFMSNIDNVRHNNANDKFITVERYIKYQADVDRYRNFYMQKLLGLSLLRILFLPLRLLSKAYQT